MKKNVFIFLSVFMLASTIQLVMAMEGEEKSGAGDIEILPRRVPQAQYNNEFNALQNRVTVLETDNQRLKNELQTRQSNECAYKDAKAYAEREGRTTGTFYGFASGVGYAVALFPWLMQENSKIEQNILGFCGLCGFAVCHWAANKVFRYEKKQYYEFLKAHQNITPVQKKELKKRYHKKEFKANTLACSIAAIGLTAGGCFLPVPEYRRPAFSSTQATFWNVLPHAAMGIVGLKLLTYTGTRSYKKWSRGN